MSMAHTQEANHSEKTIRCAACAHFAYFRNHLGHNSPNALGKCRKTPWDGNTGQWAMFPHHCAHFVKSDSGSSKL